MTNDATLTLALPKGRILTEVMPLLAAAGIVLEAAFADEGARQLLFATNQPGLNVIRVRSFDVATFVAFGAAEFGVAGDDVLQEFDYPEIYAPVDLQVGRCRLVVAEPRAMRATDDPRRWSQLRVATKYPQLTQRYFARRGVQAECVKLNGALELAPKLGLCERIVDLVATGATLKANGLVEVETILESTARLIVNRAALKTRSREVGAFIARIRAAVPKTKTRAANAR
jgi:ATP phosphoribosyltransferase